jgi:hypothetical protein
MCGMDAAFENAMRTLADSYEEQVALLGGKSLSRVATIVVNNGAFFARLREGKPFLVHNLERFADWFRRPQNWPEGCIPHAAVEALTSMGRPPVAYSIPHLMPHHAAPVAFDRSLVSKRTIA